MVKVPRALVKRLVSECRVSDSEVLYLAAVVRSEGRQELRIVTRCGRGTKDRVELSDRCVKAIVSLLATGAKLVLVHTHPDGSPLSDKDVEVSERLGIPIVAISCIDGAIYAHGIELEVEESSGWNKV